MKKTLLIFFVLFTAQLSFSQNYEIYSTKKGAVNGYDVVAYFTESKAVMGTNEHTWEWNDAEWHFASDENLQLFKAEPQKYAPQYGGYCAYGTSNGYKAPTEADAWTIVNSKLYLNYNKSVRETWSKNRDKLIEKADANWIEIKNKKP